MSRHLLIRCDNPGCTEQTETRASDDAPTEIGVPPRWLTVREDGRADRHYCSVLCMLQAHHMQMPPDARPQQSPSSSSSPSSPSSVSSVSPAPTTRRPKAAR